MRKVIDGYPYLKHLLKFWPGDWEYHLGKVNKLVCEQNKPTEIWEDSGY